MKVKVTFKDGSSNVRDMSTFDIGNALSFPSAVKIEKYNPLDLLPSEVFVNNTSVDKEQFIKMVKTFGSMKIPAIKFVRASIKVEPDYGYGYLSLSDAKELVEAIYET